jgi:hypothetical protein
MPHEIRRRPEHDFAAPAYASRPEMAAAMAGRADRKSLIGSDVDDRLPLRLAQAQESLCHCEVGPIAATLMRSIGTM